MFCERLHFSEHERSQRRTDAQQITSLCDGHLPHKITTDDSCDLVFLSFGVFCLSCQVNPRSTKESVVSLHTDIRTIGRVEPPMTPQLQQELSFIASKPTASSSHSRSTLSAGAVRTQLRNTHLLPTRG